MKLRTATLGLAAFALIACDGTNGRRSADAAESGATVTPRTGDRDIELDRDRDLNRGTPRVITAEISRTEMNRQTDGMTQQQRTEQQGTEQNTRFGIRDTVFLAVTTENPAADSRVSVRVTSEDGMVVDSTAKAVDRMGSTGAGERMGSTAARTGTQMGQTGQTGAQNTGARMGTSNQMGDNNAVTQFQLVRNNGWTAGDYTVDIWLNDRHVETKSFSVQR